jgi:hypothetical protein
MGQLACLPRHERLTEYAIVPKVVPIPTSRTLLYLMCFGTLKSVMVMLERRQEQRQRYLKAKVAMALYSQYGRVPREHEIDEVYHLTRILKVALGSRFVRSQQKHTGQLALF